MNAGQPATQSAAKFVLLWTAVTAAASGVVFLMSYWLAALLYGAILGGAQWLLLRQRFRGASWWIPANAAGWPFALAATYLLQIAARKAGVLQVSIPAYCVVAGATAGFVQWLVLRRAARHSGWWVLACAVGWGAAVTAGFYLGYAKVVPPVVAGMASGAIGGAVTGAVLVWITVNSP